jgi:two-component system sensor histidine kinase BaeS
VLRSLRFRLAAFFLASIVLSGLVAAALAFRLLDSYTLSRARADLKRESTGLAELYAYWTAHSNQPLPEKQLARASGDRLYFIPAYPGFALFPKKAPRFTRLSRRTVPIDEMRTGKTVTFEFVPPGQQRRYIAVAKPLFLGPDRNFFGAIVAARPRNQLGTRVVPLVGRLGIALLGGLLAAGLLALYLTSRITRPVRRLSQVADDVAEGRRDVEIPRVPGGGEIGHLADRLREMTSRLSEAEERERNFLMSVSHELRTPLTAIRGHVEALREGLVRDQGASLDVIAAETSRLERLVGDVLDLAKLDAHRFALTREEVDMERVCERAYDAFGEEARRREIDYRHEVGARPVIVTDGDRVLQIITNLLSNAFRWTPDGGRIDLALSSANGTVAVAVGDTGPGIAPEDRDRIFRAFWSRGGGGGTGLGLAIARELAEALGGRLDLVSEVGKGSRFELVLPADEPS